MSAILKRIRTDTLEIAYEESGPGDGVPAILLHGWPYDPRAYDDAVPALVAAGCRTVVPYLRGFGPTRFLSADTPRSGQQAALGKDLLDLWHHSPVLERARQVRRHSCAGCRYHIVQCNGGCPVMAYLNGDVDGRDPYCVRDVALGVVEMDCG